MYIIIYDINMKLLTNIYLLLGTYTCLFARTKNKIIV